MKKNLLLLGLCAILGGAFGACKSATEPAPSINGSLTSLPVHDTIVPATSDRVLFVGNEGNFGKANASLDVVVFHSGNGGKVDTTIYKGVLTGLGSPNDVVVNGNQVYMLDNTANSIDFFSASDLNSARGIPVGLDAPNKMALIGSNLLLVTRRMNNTAAIIDLTTDNIVDSIAIGEPSIAVAVMNNKAYITSSATSYAGPYHLNVVNLATRKVIKQVALTGSGEEAIADSTNNTVIIGATGDFVSNRPRLYYVNVSTDVLQDSLEFRTAQSDGEIIVGPKNFIIADGVVYRLNGISHQLGQPLINSSTSYYKGYYDSHADELYLGVNDFTSGKGKVDVYSGSTGTFKWSFNTGIAPAHFAFYH